MVEIDRSKRNTKQKNKDRLNAMREVLKRYGFKLNRSVAGLVIERTGLRGLLTGSVAVVFDN